MSSFSLIADASGTYSRSAQNTGIDYAVDYVSPTPSIMPTAISDMETAYTNAAGRSISNGATMKAGLIVGTNFTAGVHD